MTDTEEIHMALLSADNVVDALNFIQRAYIEWMAPAWDRARAEGMTEETRSAILVRGLTITIALAATAQYYGPDGPPGVPEAVAGIAKAVHKQMVRERPHRGAVPSQGEPSA